MAAGSVTAEIISVGTELLLGEITDTNAVFMSQELAVLGINLYYRHTAGDNLDRLAAQICESAARSDVILLCGGLGPTEDDVTREALAKATGRRLVRFPEAEQRLREFFAARGRELTPNNLRQAEAPEGARLLENSVGTAPGIALEHEGRFYVALPGPPDELRPMWYDSVRPMLRELVRRAMGGEVSIFTRVLRLADIGESQVAHELADLIAQQQDPSIALYASPGEVKVRLATKAPDYEAARERFGPVEDEIRRRLGQFIFGVDDQAMEAVIGDLLVARGATLAVAESCTGGLIGDMITNVPGASRYFLADFVTYSNEAKIQVLGVPAEIIATVGAVSKECAEAMARGAREKAGATYGLATTGIAGPSGGTPEKPVGTVYMAVCDANRCVVRHFVWPTSRLRFKMQVARTALGLLRRFLLGYET
ncbi:MAG: competence/damage-inducible protein A [Armatimonadetes bacterium]|nr:competence/damage-inducible protein A [Armatimonadota bacterium]